MTRCGRVRAACAFSHRSLSRRWDAGLGRWVLPPLLIVFMAGPAAGKPKVEKRLAEAASVLEETLDSVDQGIASKLLSRASCVGVFPSVWKGAFIVGGRYGKGVVSCRKSDNDWSAPANFLIEGGNFGFQIGGQATDIVLLFLNEKSVRRLLRTKFTLGGDASVAGGASRAHGLGADGRAVRSEDSQLLAVAGTFRRPRARRSHFEACP